MPRAVGLEPVAREEALCAGVLLGHPDLRRPGCDGGVEQGLSCTRAVVLGTHVQGVQLGVPHGRVAAHVPRRAADAEPAFYLGGPRFYLAGPGLSLGEQGSLGDQGSTSRYRGSTSAEVLGRVTGS